MRATRIYLVVAVMPLKICTVGTVFSKLATKSLVALPS